MMQGFVGKPGPSGQTGIKGNNGQTVCDAFFV